MENRTYMIFEKKEFMSTFEVGLRVAQSGVLSPSQRRKIPAKGCVTDPRFGRRHEYEINDQYFAGPLLIID